MNAKISTFRRKSHFGFWVVLFVWFLFVGGGSCLGLMGREAMEMKWRMFGGDRARGPWLKEKRMSLKVPSQTRKKVVGPARWKEERFKGRMRKR